MVNQDFIKRLDRLSKATRKIPARAAVVAVNFSKERFIRKNWVDTSPEAWAKRKEGRKGRGSLMIRSGRLKRSIRKIRITNQYILIGTDVPYAQIHNQGGKIEKTVTVKEHQRRIRRGRKTETKVKPHKRNIKMTMPKRQFMGNSAVLQRRIERLIEKDFKQALK